MTDFGQFMQAELAPDALDLLNKQEQIEKKARLIPTGTYEGVIQPEWEVRTMERSDSPYFGEPMVRATAELYNVGENMATRKFSFNVTSQPKIKTNGRMEGAYKLYLQMAKHTGAKTLQDALTNATQTRLRFRIDKIGGKVAGDDPRNYVAAISPVSAG